MEKNQFVLEVSHLQTEFRVGRKTVRAVNDASFRLRRGKTLGVVGESGCGKSATAHSILQILPRSGYIEGGQVTYRPSDETEIELTSLKRDGKEMRSVRGGEIAMIFQDPMSSLNPVYTVGKQITENLLNHERISKKDARERAISMLSELGIPIPEKRFDEYPHQFSGGMKQRVMIAIAMICNPSILIADEPTTALDVTIQAQILYLMRRLRDTHGASIVLITHNMGIVAEICDDVAVMYMGRIVESGSAEQVFNNPLHPYTQALLKSVPIPGAGRINRLVTIQGTTPDASDAFVCCEFEPRCTLARPECRACFPTESEPEDGHLVRCRLHEGVAINAG